MSECVISRRKGDTTDLEQAQSLDLVQLVKRETVVDACR